MVKKTRDEIVKEIWAHGKEIGFPNFPKDKKSTKKTNNKK